MAEEGMRTFLYPHGRRTLYRFEEQPHGLRGIEIGTAIETETGIDETREAEAVRIMIVTTIMGRVAGTAQGTKEGIPDELRRNILLTLYSTHPNRYTSCNIPQKNRALHLALLRLGFVYVLSHYCHLFAPIVRTTHIGGGPHTGKHYNERLHV